MVPICVLGGRGAESGAAVCKLAAVDEVLRFKKNVAIWVGYVGTDYKGLQIQRGVAGTHSVENELEEAIYKAGGISEENYRHLDKVRWKRSSRTDKGVHSLCTVVTMKLEVAVNSWLNDVDGIKIADAFNAYLPANISIFGVVPVTKSFDARRSCYSRTYDYYFPAACIGISNESSSEDVDQRIQDFRRTLKSLEGRHAFHNYTVRRLYRKSQRRGTYSPSRNLIADEESSEDEEPSFKDTHDEQDNPAADIGEERGAGRRAYWLDESEEGKDPVKASHFRNVAKCTCEGPEKLNCPSSVVRIRVTGESFMVHQIRKMVGTAIAVFRHVLPEDAIPVSTCRHARVVLPLAPPHGLVLSGNSFFPFRGGYTRAKGGTGGYFFSKLGIQVSSQIAERMNSFWLEKLAPVISSSMNEEEAPWSQWLESLELNRIDDLEFANLRDAWKQWQSMATMRRYSDEH